MRDYNTVTFLKGDRFAMKRWSLPLLLLLLCLLLSGCGDSAREEAIAAKPTTATETAKTAEVEWRIARSDLGTEPSFPEWNQNGTTIQLIALVDENGTPHIAYNTCQVCAGSPYAYFEYRNGRLQCMNCGNEFALSTVGETAGGCTPMPVGTYTTTEDALILPQSELERAASVFANWKKGL